jgi:hypothetical protein
VTRRPREMHWPHAPELSPQPVLLAVAARTARHSAACALCGWTIHPGQRVADLADGSGAIHVSCASATPG